MSCIIKRILTIQTPIKYRAIQLWDEHDNDITNSCSYSWSLDSVCWTNWTNYETYTKIGPNIDGEFYLRIMLYSGFSRIAVDHNLIDCYSICLAQTNPYLEDPCTNNIDLYSNLDCAIQMQQFLSDLVCCTIGIPCYYFRVLPDQDTKDLTFREYVLHNVVDMKYIKLVCQEGELPSSKPQMTEFDFDWDTDWEVEVGKTMFARAFGDTAFPKQRDIVYIPMMKRMYEVNAAYDEKKEKLMWRATTWNLALVKWSDKSNVEQGDFESVIDDWIENKMSDILPTTNTEQKRESGVAQIVDTYGPNNLTRYVGGDMVDLRLSDKIRSYISRVDVANIIDRTINHGSVVVSRNAYAFKNPESQVVYQDTFCGDSGTIIFMITYSGCPCDIVRIGDIVIKCTESSIIFGSLEAPLETGKTYIVTCTWSRSLFIQSMSIYKHFSINSSIPVYMLRPEMYKFDFENPVYNSSSPYDNDYIIEEKTTIVLTPGTNIVSNLKIYDTNLDNGGASRESIKYLTSNEHCVLNDVARTIEAPYGYSVR